VVRQWEPRRRSFAAGSCHTLLRGVPRAAAARPLRSRAVACDTLETVASVLDDLVVALAELYLDTDVRDTLPRLAQRIVSSGQTRGQIEQLWRRQITPAVHWNLRSAAGEWAGFDRRWLLGEVARRRERRGSLESWPVVGRVLHRLRAYGAEPEFRAAQWLAERLRGVPEPARARRVAIWQALLTVYYAVDGELGSPHIGAGQSRPPSQRSADSLVRRHELDPSELSDEFRVICDVLAPLLSRTELGTAAESHVAAWLDRLSQPKH
jgi:hypothetical protein